MLRPRNMLAALAPMLLCAFLLVGCNAASKEVVATYKGGTVSQEEFEKQFHFQRELVLPTYQATAENKKAFLEEYITLYKVLLAEAKASDIEVDDNEMAEQVDIYKEQVTSLVYNGDQKKFEEQLKKFDIKDEDIKELARNDTYLRLYREQKIGPITPTEDELKTYFEGNKARFATGTISHVLVQTKEEAQTVKDRLAKGEDFAKLAGELSIDPTAKQNGGTMTDVHFDMFVGEFRDAAAALPLNTLSDPVQTEYGWHIIRVDQRVEPTFEAAKADVETKVREAKETAIWTDIYEKARQSAEIQVEL